MFNINNLSSGFGNLGGQVAGAFGNAASNVGNSIGNAWNSLFRTPTQTGRNSNTNYDLSGNVVIPSSTSTSTPTVNTATADNNAALKASQDTIAALTNQLSQQARLPQFDILGNYNKAKAKAAEIANPLWNQKLNNFLQGMTNKRTEKTKLTELTRENSQQALANALSENVTSRGRTGEDLLSAISNIGVTEQNYLTDENKQFDTARRALQEEIAGTGATDTGLGQQTIGTQLADRNISNERQITEYSNQKAAKQLLATRTIADLATGDVRAGEKKGQEDKATQIDFDSYMADLANEEVTGRLQNDLDRALDIASKTNDFNQQGKNEWLAGLAGSGARAQDIALAYSVYGR